MATALRPHTRTIFAAARAFAVVFSLLLIGVGAQACPTGQAGCGMMDRMDKQFAEISCLLACNVPVQANALTVAGRAEKITVLSPPVVLPVMGIVTQPDVPPPRPVA